MIFGIFFPTIEAITREELLQLIADHGLSTLQKIEHMSSTIRHQNQSLQKALDTAIDLLTTNHSLLSHVEKNLYQHGYNMTKALAALDSTIPAVKELQNALTPVLSEMQSIDWKPLLQGVRMYGEKTQKALSSVQPFWETVAPHLYYFYQNYQDYPVLAQGLLGGVVGGIYAYVNEEQHGCWSQVSQGGRYGMFFPALFQVGKKILLTDMNPDSGWRTFFYHPLLGQEQSWIHILTSVAVLGACAFPQRTFQYAKKTWDTLGDLVSWMGGDTKANESEILPIEDPGRSGDITIPIAIGEEFYEKPKKPKKPPFVREPYNLRPRNRRVAPSCGVNQ